MWIASILGWFSVVRDAERAGHVLVRARARADINNLYRAHRQSCPSMTPPSSDEARDYRYRLSISREDWIKLAGKLAEEVDYPNFKMAVHERADQANKHAAYAEIWWIMRRGTKGETRTGRPPKGKRQKKDPPRKTPLVGHHTVPAD